MEDVEPKVQRHRLVIEGLLDEMIYRPAIDEYLLGLSKVSGMTVVIDPAGFDGHPGGGSATWIHWNSSGAHFYVYSASPHSGYGDKLPYPLFTLDTYTCKPFSVEAVVEYTKQKLNPRKMTWFEVDVTKMPAHVYERK